MIYLCDKQEDSVKRADNYKTLSDEFKEKELVLLDEPSEELAEHEHLEDNAIHSECEASDDMQSVVEAATECTQAAQSVAEPEPVYSWQHVECAKVLALFKSAPRARGHTDTLTNTCRRLSWQLSWRLEAYSFRHQSLRLFIANSK